MVKNYESNIVSMYVKKYKVSNFPLELTKAK